MIGDRFLPKKYEAPELESPAYGGSRRRPEQAGLSGAHMTAPETARDLRSDGAASFHASQSSACPEAPPKILFMMHKKDVDFIHSAN